MIKVVEFERNIPIFKYLDKKCVFRLNTLLSELFHWDRFDTIQTMYRLIIQEQGIMNPVLLLIKDNTIRYIHAPERMEDYSLAILSEDNFKILMKDLPVEYKYTNYYYMPWFTAEEYSKYKIEDKDKILYTGSLFSF